MTLTLDELGPTYSATLAGNIFNGTGANTLVFSETQTPGPSATPDTIRSISAPTP